MGLFRNRLTRRSSKLGLASDVALVGAAAGRLAGRRSGRGAGSPTELVLAGGAAFRLLRRFLRRRRNKRSAKAELAEKSA